MNKIGLSLLFCLAIVTHNYAQNNGLNQQVISIEKVSALKDLLANLSVKSDNEYFKLHCHSIMEVINAKSALTKEDTILLGKLFDRFKMDSLKSNLENPDTYYKRKREFIIAWKSPTDGATSFTWLKFPKDWNASTKYPLYIELHGHWDVADNPVNHLTFPFLKEESSSVAFEDGFLISPWGRGNLWYQGISEIDILECIANIESLVNVATYRRFLFGFSMGGYGTWMIGQKYKEKFAALGLHNAALQGQQIGRIKQEVNSKLNDVPVYIICGNKDNGIIERSEEIYNLLRGAGNKNIEFSIFEGEHMYNPIEIERMNKWMKQLK